jgi:hypothetical protein
MAAARRRACLAALRASQNPKALANPLQDDTGLLGRCLGNLIPLGTIFGHECAKDTISY